MISSRAVRILLTVILGLSILAVGPMFIRLIQADRLARQGVYRLVENPLEARGLFARSASLSPGDPYYHYLSGLAAIESAVQPTARQFDDAVLLEAEEALSRALALNPDEGAYWHTMSRASLILAGRPKYRDYAAKADFQLRQGLEKEPNNPDLLLNAVRSSLESGQADGAAEYLTKLAVTAPDSYLELREMASWTEAARESFAQGLHQARQNPLTARSALSALALIAEDKGDWAAAIDYNRRIAIETGVEPGPEQYFRIGLYQLRAGQSEEARASFLEGLKRASDAAAILSSLAPQFLMARAIGAYIDLCQQAAKYDPIIREKLPLLLGEAYFLNDELEIAGLFLRRSIETRETPIARLYLGKIGLNKRNWKDAEFHSRQGLALDAKDSELHYILAQALRAQGKTSLALSAVQTAIAGSDYPKAEYFELQGRILWDLGEWEKAGRAWQDALSRAPNNVSIIKQLAEVYLKLGQPRLAERYYLKALVLKPDDSETSDRLTTIREAK